jgi:hypothetical protein
MGAEMETFAPSPQYKSKHPPRNLAGVHVPSKQAVATCGEGFYKLAEKKGDKIFPTTSNKRPELARSPFHTDIY